MFLKSVLLTVALIFVSQASHARSGGADYPDMVSCYVTNGPHIEFMFPQIEGMGPADTNARMDIEKAGVRNLRLRNIPVTVQLEILSGFEALHLLSLTAQVDGNKLIIQRTTNKDHKYLVRLERPHPEISLPIDGVWGLAKCFFLDGSITKGGASVRN